MHFHHFWIFLHWPAHIGRLGINESTNITIEINAPGYFTRGFYELEFTITGDVVKNETNRIPLTHVRRIELQVLDLPREDAETYKLDSENYVSDMNQKSFGTKGMQKLLEELLDAFNETDFKKVKEIYDEMKENYNAALGADKGIKELSEKIKEAESMKVDVSKTERLNHLAQSALERENYVEALARVEEAMLTYAIETGGTGVRMKELQYSMKTNPIETTTGFFSFGALIIASTFFTRWRYLKRKLKKLSEEETLLMELMRTVQREVFEKAKMSMKEYGDSMEQYEERLNKVIQDKIAYRNKRNNLLKFKSKLNKLKEERENILNLTKKAQEAYITGGKYETRVYENMFKSYSARLTDIEEELAMADIKKAFKKN